MKNTIIGLVGASGLGSEVSPLLENQIKAQEDFEGCLRRNNCGRKSSQRDGQII